MVQSICSNQPISFSYFVIKGIRDNLADKDKNGNISVNELKEFVSQSLYDFTSGRQKPTIREENNYYNWSL